MTKIFSVVLQLVTFLLFQTVLQNLVGESRFEKYIHIFSGFLVILLLFSGISSLWSENDLLSESRQQIEFALNGSDFRQQLANAEENAKEEILEAYRNRIMEEIKAVLAEERFFLVEGKVTFSEQGEIESLYGKVSRVWQEETEEKSGKTTLPIRIETITIALEELPNREEESEKGESHVKGETPAKKESSVKTEAEENSGNEDEISNASKTELDRLRHRLADRLGVEAERIWLESVE